jgi:two-component system nitrate/nitrite response regulator NarL
LEGQQLTPREREVLALLVEGLSGVVIANRLGISRNTVRTHVQSILTKLQVHSRLEAATFAVRHRLVHTNVPQAVEAVG